MPTFSQRHGLEPAQKLVQLGQMDIDLRNGLWTALSNEVFSHWRPNGYAKNDAMIAIDLLIWKLWVFHLKLASDTVPESYSGAAHPAVKQLRPFIISGPWNKALDLIEFVLHESPAEWIEPTEKSLNFFFERENSAYRVIHREIVPISDATEMEVVNTALVKGRPSEKAHFKRALELLSDRASPDYRNSIKESISAVESACQSIAGDSTASLGECLGKIKKHHKLHQSFEKALHQLYGFTSDSSGIRHALSDGATSPTYADAKFMLVSCTTFVNYLWNVVAEAKIET